MSFAKRVIRQFFKEGSSYPIAMGPLRGKKIVYHSKLQIHALFGLYDRERIRTLEIALRASGVLRPDLVCADVGSNLGYYSIWFSKIAPQGKIYAFEPNPLAAKRIEENVLANHLSGQVEVVRSACSDVSGEVELYIAEDSWESASLDPRQVEQTATHLDRIVVPTVSLDDFFFSANRPLPNVIKMDIEGAGTLALPGAKRVFEKARPIILFESHVPEEDRALSDVCLFHEYDAYRITNRRWVKNLAEIHPNPDGIWGHLIVIPRELRASVARQLK